MVELLDSSEPPIPIVSAGAWITYSYGLKTYSFLELGSLSHFQVVTSPTANWLMSVLHPEVALATKIATNADRFLLF